MSMILKKSSDYVKTYTLFNKIFNLSIYFLE